MVKGSDVLHGSVVQILQTRSLTLLPGSPAGSCLGLLTKASAKLRRPFSFGFIRFGDVAACCEKARCAESLIFDWFYKVFDFTEILAKLRQSYGGHFPLVL